MEMILRVVGVALLVLLFVVSGYYSQKEEKREKEEGFSLKHRYEIPEGTAIVYLIFSLLMLDCFLLSVYSSSPKKREIYFAMGILGSVIVFMNLIAGVMLEYRIRKENGGKLLNLMMEEEKNNDEDNTENDKKQG